MRIAVVIPTLNESANIAAAIASLAPGRPDFVIVADCDSPDDTADRARAAGATVLTHAGLRSRGEALQAGANLAQEKLTQAGTGQAEEHRDAPHANHAGDVIWFLHADTLAPPDWRTAIETACADPAVVGGAFTQRFTLTPPPGQPRVTHLQRRLLRFVVFANRTRYRFTRVYFGDQGIFVRAAALAQIGGVPQSPLMEDVDLCRNLLRVGQLRVSPVRLSTSPRRFLKHGVLRQLLHDWALLLTHRLGLRPQSLYAKYNQDNLDHAPENVPQRIADRAPASTSTST